MLKTFDIAGFKVFDHVKIAQLSRLNLFVGSNNAGKTCLLEAIRLWSANASPIVIKDLVRSHDGDWGGSPTRRRLNREEIEEDDFNAEDPIRFLFHNFHYDDVGSAVIEVGSSESDSRVRISLGEYQTIRSEDGTIRRVRIDDPAFAGDETDSALMLELVIGSKRRVLYSLDNLWVRRSAPVRPSALDDLPVRPLAIVGTGGISASQVSILWDRVSLTPQQDRVLNCLRLVEPAIDGLALVADLDRYSGSERIPVVSLKGKKGRFPLKTMGDGLTRLLHIALSMVNAQDGIVLIDEFENGLYWGVQKLLWPLMYELATDFNVQVFATSHSNDCVSSFIDASHKSFDPGSLYRVERSGESVRVMRLPVENVADALESQVEIR